MIPSKTILVGGTLPSADDGPPSGQPDIVRAHSYCELERLLQQDSIVHLVCTEVTLPDGNWCDVLRLVISARMTGEVRVLGVDGRTVLRLEVAPRLCSVQAFDAATQQSLAYDVV